jgi:non-ribosomal peptide synthetase component F
MSTQLSLANNIAALSGEQRELLQLTLLEEGGEYNCFPLSFAQEQLWFLDQLVPGGHLYNIPAAVRLTGPLDAAAFERSVKEIVRRHESLRTIFVSIDGRPLQAVLPPENVTVPLIDLVPLPEREREPEAVRLATEQARLPFDLERGPLLRAVLLRLDREEHVLLLTLHHIISDGWSLGVLFAELNALYSAYSRGEESRLPELPIQYGDYAAWQREWLRGEVLERQTAYWREQLGGKLPVLELPTDHARPSVQNHRGARRNVTLGGDLTRGLKELSRREGVTLYMTLLAAFQTLLNRYTGQTDILISSSVANRNRAETEGLIGLLLNIILLRTDLSGDPTFSELLGRVREVTLGAYAHQDMPFEKLVAELQPGRKNTTYMELGQVAFTLQNDSADRLKLGGLSLDSFKGDSALTAKTDLMLFMLERPDELVASIEYSTDLFDDPTIGRMLDHFRSLLEGVVADPEERLSMLAPAPGRALSPLAEDGHAEEKAVDIFERSNLTKNQILFWVGQKMHPAAPLFNMINAFTVKSSLRPALLREAFQSLVNASDALRTVVYEVDGVPQQKVLPSLSYELDYLDFSQGAAAAERCKEWVEARAQTLLNPEERLFDSALLKIADEEFVWYINHHQLIADASSTALLFLRLTEFYEAALKGEPPESVELPPFQDYVRHERQHRRTPRHRKTEAYWKEKLANPLEPIAFYGKLPTQPALEGGRVTCRLGAERLRKLKLMAAHSGVFVGTEDLSLFTVFAAAIFVYLHRISGSRRLALGVAYHNRLTKASMETIGMLMEVLPLQLTMEEGETFLSLVRRVRAETLEVLKHGQYSVSNSEQNITHHAVFNYINAPAPHFEGKPVAVEWVHPGFQDEHLALHVHRFDGTGELSVEFDFDGGVFPAEAQRHEAVRHFLRMLDTFLDDYGCSISRPDLLAAGAAGPQAAGPEDEESFDFD